jgi:hypothetical protein
MRKFVPFSKRKPREAKIERDNRNWAVKLGWFVTKIMKTSTGGFPDRFYARNTEVDRCPHCGRGRVILIEFKREDGETSETQDIRIAELRSAGVEVYVVSNDREAKKILGFR